MSTDANQQLTPPNSPQVEPAQPAATAPPSVDFGQAPLPCTFSECGGGHQWPAIFTLIPCPGCSSQMLALMMKQCPICNEPVKLTQLRLDHLHQGGPIQPICKGGDSLAEIQLMQIMHHHSELEEKNHQPKEMKSKLECPQQPSTSPQ